MSSDPARSRSPANARRRPAGSASTVAFVGVESEPLLSSSPAAAPPGSPSVETPNAIGPVGPPGFLLAFGRVGGGVWLGAERPEELGNGVRNALTTSPCSARSPSCRPARRPHSQPGAPVETSASLIESAVGDCPSPCRRSRPIRLNPPKSRATESAQSARRQAPTCTYRVLLPPVGRARHIAVSATIVSLCSPRVSIPQRRGRISRRAEAPKPRRGPRR